jgi:hypothetical protein
MKPSSIRLAAIALVGAASLGACDSGNVLLWPWVDIVAKEEPVPLDPNAPPPPPPLDAVNPLDPTQTPTGAVPNPNANTGAPSQDGTPFENKPENPAIDTGDSSPPVSAETGEPLPPLPVPTEEATNTPPATPPETPPETPPTGGPSPPEPTPVAASFYFFRSGNLAPSSGTGAPEAAALVPDMAFPIKSAPAVAQTQVYRWGGGIKGGDQCDTRNFTAPWRDNYCETRSTTNTTPWCAKTGVHLGQDIRVGTPESCRAEVQTKSVDRTRYEVVAVEDGVVSNVGSYSVTLRADSGGRIYRYLHLNMSKLKVATNQTVKQGDVIGYVSNDFGGTPTTLHLHFEIKLNTTENGWQYAPPYSSLLAAYKRRENNDGEQVADNFVVASSPNAPN